MRSVDIEYFIDTRRITSTLLMVDYLKPKLESNLHHKILNTLWQLWCYWRGKFTPWSWEIQLILLKEYLRWGS